MKKQIRLLVIACFSLLALVVFPLRISADGAGFTMEMVRPVNQLSNATYFDLKVKPEEKQTLQIKFTNLENQELKLDVSPNPAFTNGNGVIEYSKYDLLKDNSAKYTLPELVKEKVQQVTLKPEETKVISFHLEIPKESFEGMILGGFYALNKGNKIDEKETGVMIKNQYALVLGVKLQEDTDTKVVPELKLNEIKPGLDNSYTTVFANLQNIKPQSFGEMTVDAKVYRKGKKEVFKETKKEHQQMAPNSNYDFPISWNNEPVEPGDYHLSLTATSGKKTWTFERDFVISKEETENINKEAIGIKKKSYLWLYILIAILIVLILFILAFILGRKQRDKDEDTVDKKSE